MYVSKFLLLFVTIYLPLETIASPQQRLQYDLSYGATLGATSQHPITPAQRDAISRERAGKNTTIYLVGNR